jgi:hypothetical protein
MTGEERRYLQGFVDAYATKVAQQLSDYDLQYPDYHHVPQDLYKLDNSDEWFTLAILLLREQYHNAIAKGDITPNTWHDKHGDHVSITPQNLTNDKAAVALDVVVSGITLTGALSRGAGGSMSAATADAAVHDSDTDENFTPRPPSESHPRGDDTGLSTYDTPEAASPKGGKVQKIDTSLLKCTVACPDASPPGHVSVRPVDPAEIPDWMATRGTGAASPYTQDIKSAIIDTVIVPKPR